jgi:hypothetical protein
MRAEGQEYDPGWNPLNELSGFSDCFSIEGSEESEGMSRVENRNAII